MNFNKLIKSFIQLVVILISTSPLLFAHPWKPSEYIVIDTDGGIDDFRTINLLLASPSVRILGISCSNGVLSAEQTHHKLLGLLESTYHSGILTSVNTNKQSVAKNCSTAIQFDWGSATDTANSYMTHTDMLNYILKHTTERITFLNLGSLRTFVSYTKNITELKERVNKILWLADYNELTHSFNYLTDTSAYNKLLTQNIPMLIINGRKNVPDYSSEYPEELKLYGSVHALKIAASFTEVHSPFTMKMYDEVGTIYIHFPELFQTDTIAPDLFSLTISEENKQQGLNSMLLKIIQGETLNKNQLFSYFPMDTSAYAEDISPIVEATIHNFGPDEWTTCVMTMELHRHVGIYALIGAKMGIRAREYFGAGVDEMKIITYAGSIPPFSCLNDGLQVSTGATLGHGLIGVAENNDRSPSADFEYLDQKIRISLKDSYKNQIKQEIKEARMLYGLNSNDYWELVRLRAIYYWSHWDRNEIFEITKLPPD